MTDAPPEILRINRNLTELSAEETPPRSNQNPYREPLSILLLLLTSLCAVALLKPDGDPDIWVRLAVGKLIVESGSVPHQDPFSYAPKKPEWVDHEWGSGLVFYLVADAAGQAGLLLLKGLLLFGTVFFMYLRSRADSLGRPPSLLYHLLMLGALYFGFLASIRAQAFTFFFFSAWLYWLEEVRRGRKRIGTSLILLTAPIWANLHGGFLAGIGLIVLFATAAFIEGEGGWRYASMAVGAALTSLINPYGVRYWSYLFGATTMDRPGVAEWRGFSLLQPGGLFLGFKLLFVATVLATLMAVVQQRHVPRAATAIVLAVTALLGFRAVRHITFFVIAAAPYVWVRCTALWDASVRPWLLERRIAVGEVGEAAYYGISRGLLLLFAVLTLSSTPMRIVLFDEFPVRAVDFLSQNRLQGRLLVPFNFGSYAIWRLYPSLRVSMDGRYETVYLDSTYQAVREFFAGAPGWGRFLDSGSQDVILSPNDKASQERMATRPDWVVAYEDPRFRVYVRSSAQREWPPLLPPDRADPFSTKGKPRYVP